MSWIVFAIMCAVVLRVGIRTTGDLTWPPGADFSRDIASAQTIADGAPLADPLYKHETIWYNPLVPALVALINICTGYPIPLLYTRLGAYLNLMAPLGLFVLVSAACGRGVALLAVCAFLFLIPGNEPGWLCATYSPWLLPLQFVQGIFYLTLLAMMRAFETSATGWYCAAGLLLGLTCLGHTAPTLVLLGVIAGGLAWEWLAPLGNNRMGSRNLVALAGCAILVAFPLLASILGNYHGIIRNPLPGRWIAPGLHLNEAPALVGGIVRGQPWIAALSVIGLFRLIGDRGQRYARILLLWGASATLLLASAYLSQWMAQHGRRWPQPVPGFHFLFSLRAFEAVAFGVGVWTISELVARRTANRFAANGARIVLAIIIAIVVMVRLPFYERRPDFVLDRHIALAMFRDRALLELYDWLRGHTVADEVVLTAQNVSLSVVGAAGRKVVVVEPLFSNPFVDWDARATAAREMTEAVDRDDASSFLSNSSRYGVDYVLLVNRPTIGPSMSQIMGIAWHGGSWSLYRLRKAGRN